LETDDDEKQPKDGNVGDFGKSQAAGDVLPQQADIQDDADGNQGRRRNHPAIV
jgi:hypothetical protein